jgi:hypothetical protein
MFPIRIPSKNIVNEPSLENIMASLTVLFFTLIFIFLLAARDSALDHLDALDQNPYLDLRCIRWNGGLLIFFFSFSLKV